MNPPITHPHLLNQLSPVARVLAIVAIATVLVFTAFMLSTDPTWTRLKDVAQMAIFAWGVYHLVSWLKGR